MGGQVWAWLTSSEAANLGQFVGGIGVLVAVAAAIVAYRQLVATPQSHAKEIWKDYLRLCIEYPELASGEITEAHPEYKRYEWFVAFMLDACDEVLQYVEDDGGWLNAIDANLGYHKAYLATARTDAYLCQWSPKVRDRIKKLFEL